MRRSRVLAIVLLVVSSLFGCASGSKAPQVDWQLKITGAVGNPLTLSYSDLAQMPQKDLQDVVMQRSTGEPTLTAWGGVLLTDILRRAEVSTDYTGITAVAADGYGIEIPIEELEGAIVALKTGSEWISEAEPDKGPIRLVCPQAPGNRWVYQLAEIQVQP